MGNRVMKHVALGADMDAKLKELAKAHGTTVTREINKAVTEYIQRQTGSADDWLMAPVIERLLNEKNDQVEQWLRPAVWGSATYSATATLLLLELLCGQRVDPKDAKDHFQLIRGRAWRMVRSRPDKERTD